MERTCDDAAMLVLVAVGLVASFTFRDYGLGWDDYTHAEYADLLLRMYGSGFKDTGALSFANLYMYGGGFDMAAALLHKIIPLELFETRRLLGAIVGIIGLAVTWRLGRRVGGPLAGLAALLLLALCPTFYGHMFMNPKDAPFAVAMVILMLGLVRLAEEYPHPSPRTVLIVGLGAGLSIGSRILGGLALLYALIGFVPILIEEVRTHGARETARQFVQMSYALLPGLILGYLVMGLIWPWSIIEPDHPFLAATYFSHFFEKPWKELFDTEVSLPDVEHGGPRKAEHRLAIRPRRTADDLLALIGVEAVFHGDRHRAIALFHGESNGSALQHAGHAMLDGVFHQRLQ